MAQDDKPLSFGGIPFTHTAWPEWIRMPTDRFLLIVERLINRPVLHGEWIFTAMAFLFAFLWPLATTDKYKDVFWFQATDIKSFNQWGVILSVGAMIFLSVRWCRLWRKRKPVSSESLLRDVVEQMRKEEEQAAARKLARARKRKTPDQSPAPPSHE